MRKQKYHLSLTDTERHLVVQCLLDLRNALIAQGKYTDGVDEVIIKFTKYQSRHGRNLSCLLI